MVWLKKVLQYSRKDQESEIQTSLGEHRLEKDVVDNTPNNVIKRRYEFVAIIKEWIYPEQAQIINDKIEEIKNLLKE